MTITYLSFEDLYDYGLSVYKDYSTLILNGTLTLRLSNDSILNVTCVVSNTYGNAVADPGVVRWVRTNPPLA